MPGPDPTAHARTKHGCSRAVRRVLAATAVWLVLGWALGGPAVASQTDPRLDALFASLRSARNTDEGDAIATQIWQIWHEVADPAAAKLMSDGVAAMNAGDAVGAMKLFNALTMTAPDFAEGWNRRATLYYLLGDFDASVADIEKTLSLEPRHFGALSGLALIREAQHNWFEALEALDKVSRIYPKMADLEQRLDHLSQQLGQTI
jgi:tetratricopeptide (TPR) repeat protein